MFFEALNGGGTIGDIAEEITVTPSFTLSASQMKWVDYDTHRQILGVTRIDTPYSFGINNANGNAFYIDGTVIHLYLRCMSSTSKTENVTLKLLVKK